ncbi:MAG TPA: TetR family transcriptional regulator [Solirubrobacterales bacterium]|jgi:AcrR family transcriptional regulator
MTTATETAPAASARTRDAERSRRAILAAAEELFAARGFDAASLGEIGERAGVSRGTPSYFFGSKEELYATVLERLAADRTARLEPAFRQLSQWALAKAPTEPLRAVLSRAVGAYLEFLRERPSFVDVIEREALAGGARLAELEAPSTVIEDAFGTLRRRARAHGLRSFDPTEAVLCLVGLAYLPVAHRATILRRHGLSLDDPAFLRRRRRHIVDLLLHLIGEPGSGGAR